MNECCHSVNRHRNTLGNVKYTSQILKDPQLHQSCCFYLELKCQEKQLINYLLFQFSNLLVYLFHFFFKESSGIHNVCISSHLEP